ncbi:MAG: hypothetical protein HYX89_04640 [Chloroflexi bacterium]|nr:hypothetical protein [Chloroflexota bacterium]
MSFDLTEFLKQYGLAFLIAILALLLSIFGTDVSLELQRWERVVLFAGGLVVFISSYMATLRVSYKNGQINKGYSGWGKWFTAVANFSALVLMVVMAIAVFIARY